MFMTLLPAGGSSNVSCMRGRLDQSTGSPLPADVLRPCDPMYGVIKVVSRFIAIKTPRRPRSTAACQHCRGRADCCGIAGKVRALGLLTLDVRTDKRTKTFAVPRLGSGWLPAASKARTLTTRRSHATVAKKGPLSRALLSR